MEGFILNHPTLKTFSLDSEYVNLSAVAASCKTLQKLGFQFDHSPLSLKPNVESIGKFQKLKEIICLGVGNEDNMSSLVRVFPELANSLEVLDLRHGFGSHDLLQIISKIANLKILRLDDVICVPETNLNPLAELSHLGELSLSIYTRERGHIRFDLVKMVECLHNLTKLEFFVNDYKVDRKTYRQLLHCVESRPAARKRHLTIRCTTTDDFKDLLRVTVKIDKVILS